MVRLIRFAGRTDIGTGDRSRTTRDHLCIREVVIWRWIRNDEVGVVTEDAECVGVVRGDRSRDAAWKPRIHNADITGEDTAVQTRLTPVAGLIAIRVIS